jgi:hypothetical protein
MWEQTGIFTFRTVSYEDAKEIVRRLAKAGFPTAAIAIGSAGEAHEVVLHTSPANRARAKRAVYGSRIPMVLALAGGAAMLGAALAVFGSRHNPAPRSRGERRVPMQWPEVTAQSTALHMTAEQGVSDHPDGFLVLNGDADGPATTVQQDVARRDVRARSAADALHALSGRFAAVRLIEHQFPDASGQGLHRVRVWVPAFPGDGE